MRRYGAERASPETTLMHVNGELDHLVGRQFLSLVLRVWQSRVGQIERRVQLGRSHHGVGLVDYRIDITNLLQQATGVYLVGLLLDVAIVLCFGALVA